MVGAIVLAAGAGTRMGRQKLLLPFGGRTVIAHIVDQLRLADIQDVVVVVGADRDEVGEALKDHAVRIARNPDYGRGMLSSVRVGLSAAGADWSAALLALGDQPLIAPERVRAVIAAGDSERIVLPTFEGRRGHPMLLPRCYWDEAMTQHDAVGLRGVLRAHGASVREVAADSSDVLSDMDTPADYEAALARLAARESTP